MVEKMVRTAVWQGERVVIIEDIPAQACDSCLEQFYDADVSDALRRLAEDGFPAEGAQREIAIPDFSLQGRIRKSKAIPDDSYVDQREPALAAHGSIHEVCTDVRGDSCGVAVFRMWQRCWRSRE